MINIFWGSFHHHLCIKNIKILQTKSHFNVAGMIVYAIAKLVISAISIPALSNCSIYILHCYHNCIDHIRYHFNSKRFKGIVSPVAILTYINKMNVLDHITHGLAL